MTAVSDPTLLVYTSSTFRKILARAGEAAKPGLLRHSTGFKLTNDERDTRSIQHYLGHKNIQHTGTVY